ncbi:hypothetical protein RND71_021326 [Anisodus tanguticus]|uniref:Heat shock protein 70 n=1 Tax=Anisodus tanguticus TaxID=243964 RepID=A0AAE1RWZ2_9SOLA|nr:hypothetical protein RND71_021326 [Anisodus tanguticus]
MDPREGNGETLKDLHLDTQYSIASVLRKLVDDSAKFLNDKVAKAVITVPAYFNDSQRTATKDAGRIAGLRIVDWLAETFRKEEGIDLLKDKQALQLLTEAAEKAKIELSTLTQTNIRLKTPVETALKDASLSFKDIDEVVLVGGSTRIPAVQNLVRKMTGKEPNVSVNPDEVVALGASVQAGVLAGDVSDIVLLDVTPLSLGMETLGGVMTKIIPRNTTLPTSKSEVFSTAVMTKIIPRNTTLPTSKSEVFSTAADGQTSVEINVLQGEREFVKDNKSIGKFRLDGIPPAPRGVPQIEVKFDIDANGILSVTATDKGTGKKQDITITGASTLPKDEVDRMVQEAEKFAKEDKDKRDAIDTKNQAESVVYQTEKQLKEFGDKVPADVKDKVESKLNELKDAASGGSTQTIKDAMAALNQEVMQLGQSLYSQPGAAAGPAGVGPSPGAGTTGAAGSTGKDDGDGEVIDANLRGESGASPLPPKRARISYSASERGIGRNHHLSGLFGVSSLAWTGHLVHVAIPASRGESVRWNNFLDVLPHLQGLGPLFTGQCNFYAQNPDSSSHLFGSFFLFL